MLFSSDERDEGAGEGKRKSFLSYPSPLLSLPDENNMAAGKLKCACTAKAFIGDALITTDLKEKTGSSNLLFSLQQN